MNVGCVIYHYGERYEKLAQQAGQSFKKFHPDIPLHRVNDAMASEFICALNPMECKGIFKYMLAYEIMIRHTYDKIIILGGDTITCSRLDEFLDNDEDILTTLGLASPTMLPFYYLPGKQLIVLETRNALINKKTEHYNYNADVVCFNNPVALRATIELAMLHRYAMSNIEMKKQIESMLEENFKMPVFVGPGIHSDEYSQFPENHPNANWRANTFMIVVDYYAEQAGLNIVTTICETDKTHEAPLYEFDFTVKCVDDPHNADNVVYNIRSKGPVVPDPPDRADADGNLVHHKPWGPYTNAFYVKDNKLYTGEHKQIKVWHYGEGFAHLDNNEFEKLLDSWNNELFNQETINFFTDQCNCSDFFTKQGLT